MKLEVVQGPRSCSSADVSKVIALVDGVMRDQMKQSMLTDYPMVYRPENLDNVFVMTADDDVVAVVPFIPHGVHHAQCRFRVGLISPTATSPQFRRRGLALQCLSACIEKMSRDGIELSVLWTQEATFPFYERCDYQAVRDHGYAYSLGAADVDSFATGTYEVHLLGPNDNAGFRAVMQMHQVQPAGVVRSVDAYAALYRLPRMRTLLAYSRGEVVGYLVVSNAGNKPGILEAGGDPSAVEHLLRHVLEQMEPNGKIMAYGFCSPSVLGDILAKRVPGHREDIRLGEMMVRINDARALFEKLKPWLGRANPTAAREFSFEITDTGETIGVRIESDRVVINGRPALHHQVVTRRELASIVFGCHGRRPVEVPTWLTDIFPYHFPIWILDRS